MHLRSLSPGLAIAVGLAAWLGLAQPAIASIGVGVQADPVSLDGAAHPGASYALPSLYVVNTGTQAESMSVRVERLSSGPGRTVPPSWIHVTNLGGQLPPEQSARISLELVTPSDARSGDYRSDIVVAGSAAPAAAGINLGAAAATKLEFTITPGPAGRSWLSFQAWAWWLIGGLVVLTAAILGGRRSGLRIRVERRTTADGGMNRFGGHHGT
ncbi:MAG: hypothetical protein ACRDOH_17970 [Streptosporangiaceae bacterium]